MSIEDTKVDNLRVPLKFQCKTVIPTPLQHFPSRGSFEYTEKSGSRSLIFQEEDDLLAHYTDIVEKRLKVSV